MKEEKGKTAVENYKGMCNYACMCLPVRLGSGTRGRRGETSAIREKNNRRAKAKAAASTNLVRWRARTRANAIARVMQSSERKRHSVSLIAKERELASGKHKTKANAQEPANEREQGGDEVCVSRAQPRAKASAKNAREGLYTHERSHAWASPCKRARAT
eukprot:3611598-Pleurochrysis_carterae.AAC.1